MLRINQGAIAEHLFITELLSRQLETYKPIIDVYGSDILVKTSIGYRKVQVKSTSYQNLKDTYKFNLTRSDTEAYSADDFDLVALYIFDLDIWYIIPHAILEGMRSIRVRPYSSSSKYNKYFNAFHLLE